MQLEAQHAQQVFAGQGAGQNAGQDAMRGTPEQGQADRVLVLSDADRAALNAQASRGLLLALAAQGALGLAAAVIAGLSEGQRQVGRRWRGQERISYPMRCSHCAWLSAYGPDGPVLYLSLWRVDQAVRNGIAVVAAVACGARLAGLARGAAGPDPHLEGISPAIDVPQVVIDAGKSAANEIVESSDPQGPGIQQIG